MGTDIEKLIALMIQERMQNQSEEQKEAVRHYCDSIFDSGTESECFFYRLGLKDGIRLWKFMKKLMKTVS